MSEIDDYEMDDDHIDDVPISKKDGVLAMLRERNLLRYGALISESDIEAVMDISKVDLGAERWWKPKLQLTGIIKNQGYYVTERGRQGSLYILLPHEMPSANEKKNKANYEGLVQRTRALHMIDQTLLSDEHKKKLEFEIFQNAHFQIEMGKAVKKRCR